MLLNIKTVPPSTEFREGWKVTFLNRLRSRPITPYRGWRRRRKVLVPLKQNGRPQASVQLTLNSELSTAFTP